MSSTENRPNSTDRAGGVSRAASAGLFHQNGISPRAARRFRRTGETEKCRMELVECQATVENMEYHSLGVLLQEMTALIDQSATK